MSWKANSPWMALILALMAVAQAGGNSVLPKFEKGDHVCLMGNTLAERMQHHGWLETLIQSRLPGYELRFRNLGFSGDELTQRLRSDGFGSPDEHLTFNKADVIFAFFGYNESFGGLAGLEKFKRDLDTFLKHTLGQRYNGKSPPRLILFSPIAHENLHDRNLPDGIEQNKDLELYTEAMRKAAEENNVGFVDLFKPSQELYSKSERPLTIDGVHLCEQGDKLLAPVIEAALFAGEPGPKRDPAELEKLRGAVLEKNFYWFERYRTVDGYSIYGGRADLTFVDGQTNRDVAQREMEVLDLMTANRDKRVWAVAQGKDLQVDDSNTPPFIPVKTNLPGPGPNGAHIFLGGEEAIGKMRVAQGMKVNLFASEEMFPELAKPVQMAFDTKGRLWVSVMPSYPHWKPKEEMNDKVLILEDKDGDGKADKLTVFADKLHVPTGLELWGGGLFVGQAPDLMFFKDTDGDDVADQRERVLNGLDSADTHHTMNSFVLDPGGALYFQEGTFHHTQVETPYGPPERCANAGVFRYEPRTHKFEVYVSYAFANPHGHVFDGWGQDFVTDGTGNVNYYATAFSGRIDFPRKHSGMDPFFNQRTRPSPGTEILSSRHFPEELQGDYLVANVIGFQGILHYRIQEKDSGFAAAELEPMVQSPDPNFRPADIEIGPDGAIYFLDWQNPVIGHMQHNLRDPSRDRTHGRVYRVTYPARQLLKPARIAGEPIEKLLDLLKEPENRVRYRAKIELGGRDSDQVIACLKRWIDALDRDDPNREHHLMEALWVHQYHNVVNEDLLRRMLRSEDFHARAAATRVLCYWRDRISDPLGLLKAGAEDPYPRVRLEAVRASSFFREGRAVEVALTALEHPTDYYLNYTLRETLKQLEPYWKKAIQEGSPLAAGNPAAVDYLLETISTAELLKLPRSSMVCEALLSRENVLHEARHEALKELAKLKQSDGVTELLLSIRQADGKDGEKTENVLHDLAHLLTTLPASELKRARERISSLAQEARRPFTRQIAYVALVSADGSLDPAWSQAVQSIPRLRDMLEAVPLIPEAELRASAYGRIEPLLFGLPAGLASQANDEDGLGSVRRAAMRAVVSTGINEEGTFKTLARFAREGDQFPAAVGALGRVPGNRWPHGELRPLIDTVVEHIGKLKPEERTAPAERGTFQLGNDLAALLPPAEAKAVRRTLRDLGVPVIVIRTIPHLMVYDRTQIYMEAGKPVEVIFENTDIMPHNLIIARPKALEKVGLEAERMAADPNAFAKNFVPKVPEVLQATPLLQPGQTRSLSFSAPSELGDYPFLCTFPGHWRRMNGILHVVQSLDEVPPEALASSQSPPTATRPFVRAWTLDELAGKLDHLDHGRNMGHGKELFTELSCVQCHRKNGVGGQVGPDLADVRQKLAGGKMTLADVLTEMLEPSKVIDKKYRTEVLVLSSGSLVSGIVMDESEKEVRIRGNPADQKSAEPQTIPLADIIERAPSAVSMMPAGLLNTLTEEEILDLLAYVLLEDK